MRNLWRDSCRWVAGQYEASKGRLRAEISQLRDQPLQAAHKRTPDIVANLAVGFQYFLRFARECEAISEAEQKTLWKEAWASLTEAATAQGKHQAASEPARRFIELLTAALASGRAHVAVPDGSVPKDTAAWGWRKKTVGTGEYEREETQPQGERVGWVDGDELYLSPETSFATVQRLARDQGESLPVTPQTLRKRLKEQGYLASWGEATQTVMVRRTLEGRKMYVLHVHKDVFTEGLSPEKKPSITSTNPSTGQR